MNKTRKIFLNFSEKVVYILFTVIILYLFFVSLFSSCVMEPTYAHTYFIKDFPELLAPGLILLLFLLLCLNNYIDDRKDRWNKEQIRKWLRGGMAAITIGWFLLMLYWIKEMPTIWGGDQRAVFNAAKQFLMEDYSTWAPMGYMYQYPFQNTMMLLYAVFHFVFGEYVLLAVKLFNLLCWYAAILAICKLAEQYFGRRTAIWTYVALLSFLPMFTYVIFIYGTVPGICFSAWGVYQEKKFEETGENKYLVGTGILLLLAVMWKNNCIIFMIAVMIMLAVHAIREKSAKPLLGILWVFGLYWAGTQGVLAFIRTVTGQDTGNGIPLIGCIVDGLGESWMAPGWFNGYKEKLYEKCNGNLSLIKSLMVQDFKNSIILFVNQPEYAVRFFARKIASMWSSPWLECKILITNNCPRGSLAGIFENVLYDGRFLNIALFLLLNVAQSILYFGILLFLIFDRKKKDLKKVGLIICFLGGFLLHFLWEAKTQYVLLYYVMLFPYGMEGFRVTLEHFTKMRKQRTNKEECGKTGRLAIIWKDTGVKLLVAIFILIIIVEILPENIITSAIKLGIDTEEYIWFCQNNV